MARANHRQAETYKHHLGRQIDLTEKEKYAQRLGDQGRNSVNIYNGGGETQVQGGNVPLGKYIS